MSWIKRNLFFVILSFVALLLMGAGVYYLIAQYSNQSGVAAQIKEKRDQLTALNNKNPHPGNDQIDNIKNAQDQEKALRAYQAKLVPLFKRITPIPESVGTNRISNSEFAADLRNTITELHRTAMQQSVLLPNPDYYFSFESQRKIMIFDPTGLEKLAAQLGEIKALSQVLFDAKINSLDSIRRESVSTNDNTPSDYIVEKTVVTPLADFSPYELTFHCFSTELAFVMSHYATSSNGFVIKYINVESSGSINDDMPNPNSAPSGAPAQNGMMIDANGNPIARPPGSPAGFLPPGGSPVGGQPGRPTTGTGYAPSPVNIPGGARTSGPQVFLTEKPFRVSMLIYVPKLKVAGAK